MGLITNVLAVEHHITLPTPRKREQNKNGTRPLAVSQTNFSPGQTRSVQQGRNLGKAISDLDKFAEENFLRVPPFTDNLSGPL